MRKKFYAGLMIAGVMAVLSACSSDEGSNTDENTTKEQETTKEAEAPTIATEPVVVETSEYHNPLTGFSDTSNLVYGGDPAALVDGDKVYLYTGHDTSTKDSYVIPEYQCYSTTDMLNWTYEGVVLKCTSVSWMDNNSAWASQCTKHYDPVEGKDKYYLYTCSWDNTSDGKQSIGVAVSDSPTGPFKDIGQPLVKGTVTTDESSGWNDIDPSVWIEKDENGVEHRYLCWGNGKYYICELNEDMISVKDLDGDGQITFGKDILEKKAPESFTEAPWLYRRQDENGNYYGDYYLFYAYGWREQMAYATTDDLINGEWEFGGILMEPTATSNTNHASVIDFKGQTYFIYHNGSLEKGSGYRRVACAELLTFNEDGSIDYIQETATGIAGTTTVIKDLKGNTLSHEAFQNSSDDGKYPYINLAVGTGASDAEEDSLWVILPGKAEPENENYISIVSYNKPGLYITGINKLVKISQNANGNLTDEQTFKTVKGLAGEGVSFESVAQPGMFITCVSDKVMKLTDGSDKEACSFILEQQE